jgi:hypothetical protein
MVAAGCYCGIQPVNGVAIAMLSYAQACEATASASCTRGCATVDGQLAQDGNSVADGDTIAVRCDVGLCKTYVP